MSKEVLKNKIIGELYNSGEIHKMLSLAIINKFKRNKSKLYRFQDGKLMEDMVSEVFLHLCEYPTEKLIHSYNRPFYSNYNYVHFIAANIIKWKILSSNVENPNRSFLNHTLHASVFNQFNIEATLPIVDKVDEVYTEIPRENKYTIAYDELEEFDKDFLSFVINKKVGKYSNEHKRIKQKLKLKLNYILIKNKEKEMNQKIALESTDYLSKFIDEWKKSGQWKMTQDDIKILANTWYFLTGETFRGGSCAPCCRENIYRLLSWSERIRPALEVEQILEKNAQDKVDEVADKMESEEPKIVEKKPRKKK